jgi:hypothetical protein
MAPPAQSWDYPTPASGETPGPNVATWNNGVLTDTVLSGGAFIASFAGQCYQYLNTPLPGWQYGLPS